MTKEQKQKKEIAEKTILTLYTKYINKKKETVTKTVSFLLRMLKKYLRGGVFSGKIIIDSWIEQ